MMCSTQNYKRWLAESVKSTSEPCARVETALVSSRAQPRTAEIHRRIEHWEDLSCVRRNLSNADLTAHMEPHAPVGGFS